MPKLQKKRRVMRWSRLRFPESSNCQIEIFERARQIHDFSGMDVAGFWRECEHQMDGTQQGGFDGERPSFRLVQEPVVSPAVLGRAEVSKALGVLPVTHGLHRAHVVHELLVRVLQLQVNGRVRRAQAR